LWSHIQYAADDPFPQLCVKMPCRAEVPAGQGSRIFENGMPVARPREEPGAGKENRQSASIISTKRSGFPLNYSAQLLAAIALRLEELRSRKGFQGFAIGGRSANVCGYRQTEFSLTDIEVHTAMMTRVAVKRMCSFLLVSDFARSRPYQIRSAIRQ
jgi:hypothetical protein